MLLLKYPGTVDFQLHGGRSFTEVVIPSLYGILVEHRSLPSIFLSFIIFCFVILNIHEFVEPGRLVTRRTMEYRTFDNAR